MAVRVTTSEVKEIISTALTDLDPFIQTANALINDALSEEISAGTVSSAILFEMELWLAAHFTAIRDPQAKSEKVGQAAIAYWGQSGKGLESTPFGQQALAIDPSGMLSNLGAKKAEVKVIDI